MHRNPIGQLGNTRMWPFCAALPWATTPGRTKRLASLIICFSRLRRFHRLSCHSRPDRRGHIQCITHWRWLLRSSQCCLRYLALRLRRPRPRGPERQRFHVPGLSQDGLGPLCTPAVRHSRRATLESPNLTAYRFGPSLDQPRMACSL